MKSSPSTDTTPPTLTGSWRSFSADLTPSVAQKVQAIQEATLESLRIAGKIYDRLHEEKAAPQAFLLTRDNPHWKPE